MEYDAYQAVAGLLREIGYKEIGDYIDKHRDNDKFFESCVNLILHKTPSNLENHAKEILHVCGILPDYK